MIVEMRTTRVKSKTQKRAEERFAQGLAERTKLSPLGGYFHTDVGHIDNMIELWPYENMAQREDVQERAAKMGWRPDATELIVEQETKILKPAPFSPPFKTGKFGNVYEIRQYIYQAGNDSQGDRGVAAVDRSAAEGVAHGGLLVHGHRAAAPMGAHLAVSGRGGTAADSRGDGGAQNVAAGDGGMVVKMENSLALPGAVFAAAVSTKAKQFSGTEPGGGGGCKAPCRRLAASGYLYIGSRANCLRRATKNSAANPKPKSNRVEGSGTSLREREVML